MNTAIYRSGHLHDLILIHPDLIQKVEVLHGSSSLRYGGGVIGGHIKVHSLRPPAFQDSLHWEGFAKARYSSAFGEYSVSSSLARRTTKSSHRLSMGFSRWSKLRTGRWRSGRYGQKALSRTVQVIDTGELALQEHQPNHQVPSVGMERYNLQYRGRFKVHPNHLLEVQAMGGLVPQLKRTDRTLPNGLQEPRYAEWYYGPQFLGRVAVALKSSLGNALADQLLAKVAYHYAGESRHTRPFFQRYRTDRFERVAAPMAYLRLSKSLGTRSMLEYGTDVRFNHVQSSARFQPNQPQQVAQTRYPAEGSQWFSTGLYGRYLYEASPQLNFELGLRAQYNAMQLHFGKDTRLTSKRPSQLNQNGAWAGHAGLTYKWPQGWYVRGLLATGFRAPNVDDAAKVFDSEPGRVIVPNPDLNPEYSLNAETVLGYAPPQKQWSIELAAWNLYVWNAMARRLTPFNGQDSILYEGQLSEVQSLQNVAGAWHRGLLLRGTIQLEQHLTLEARMQVQRGTVYPEAIPAPKIPPAFGRLTLNYERTHHRVELMALFNGRKPAGRFDPKGSDSEEFFPEEGNPAWWTLNIFYSYQWKHAWTLSCGLENLLDQHYRSFGSRVSGPGRNGILRMHYRW